MAGVSSFTKVRAEASVMPVVAQNAA